MIRVYDETGNVIETHEHAGEFKFVPVKQLLHLPQPLLILSPLCVKLQRKSRRYYPERDS